MLAINPEIYDAALSAESANPADTASKILSFEDLPIGWHYGEGGPITESVIGTALDIYWRLSSFGFEDTDAFPGTYGEIMVTAYRGHHYIELIVETDGTVSVCYERGGEDVYSEEHLEFGRALDMLKKISEEIWAEEIWSTSDSSIRNILTGAQTKTVSRVWPSGTIHQAGAPFNNLNASLAQVEQFAPMQDNFTLITSLENHQYSGYLTIQFSQKEAS
jgi:hypothetical protein